VASNELEDDIAYGVEEAVLVVSNELEDDIAYGVEEAVVVDSKELEDGIAYGFKELVLVANNSLEAHGVEEAVAKNETIEWKGCLLNCALYLY
jgi:hypothetical protein